MIRVILPAHLRTMARHDGEVHLEVEGDVTQRSVLDALEDNDDIQTVYSNWSMSDELMEEAAG